MMAVITIGYNETFKLGAALLGQKWNRIATSEAQYIALKSIYFFILFLTKTNSLISFSNLIYRTTISFPEYIDR